jgi:glucosamine-6-phosphate deaminase
MPRRAFHVDGLRIEVHSDRQQMGRAAALDVAAIMREILAGGPSLSMVFAAAPSQNELLATLSILPGLDWQRMVAFHMDEYVGLPIEATQR